MRIDQQAGLCYVTDSEARLYQDCPPEVAADAAARLTGQSLAIWVEPVSAAAWKYKPSAYLICEDDRAVPGPVQEQLADGPQDVERIASGHSPFLSRPTAVEEFLRRAVSVF